MLVFLFRKNTFIFLIIVDIARFSLIFYGADILVCILCLFKGIIDFFEQEDECLI